jgi:hypothetical protein
MRRFLPINLILLLLLSSMVQAATYYVANTGNDSNPGTPAAPFKTIQRGLNAAASGDFVQVADGIYTGVGNRDLNYNGKNLTLKSVGGATKCIIDCEQAARGINFRSGETAAAVLDGFTIQNGRRIADGSGISGGGINIGGRIASPTPSSPTIKNCILQGNTSETAGGAAVVADQCEPTFINCLITRNSAVFGGAFRTDGRLTLINCTIADNNTMWFTSAGHITVINCILWNNGRNDFNLDV